MAYTFAIDMDGFIVKTLPEKYWEPDPETGFAPWEMPYTRAFANAEADDDALTFVKDLIRIASLDSRDNRFVIVSQVHKDVATAMDQIRQKEEWLKAHDLDIPFLPCPWDMEKVTRVANYFKAPLDRSCILIDDWIHNVQEWSRMGGTAFLWTSEEARMREAQILAQNPRNAAPKILQLTSKAAVYDVLSLIKEFTKTCEN